MAPSGIENVSKLISCEYIVQSYSEDGALQYSFKSGTCVAVLCYVIKLRCDKSMSDVIRRLNDLSAGVVRGQSMSMGQEEYHEFVNLFTGSFVPQAKAIFKVPKVEQLIMWDEATCMPPKKNEILAGFIDFLLQVLDSVARNDGRQYAVLQKEVTFLLTFLGDVPFQCTDLEGVKDLLAQFENVANEAASLIYSIAFDRMQGASSLDAQKLVLLEKIELLNAVIKDHCARLEELRMHPIRKTPRSDTFDSLFIVDSLVADLESWVVYGRFAHFSIDDHIIKDQVTIVHEELTSSRALLQSYYDKSKDDDQLKESSLQIRDVAYEAEYLINLYVVGNVPSWYMSLRLPSVIHKLKLIRTRLEGTKKMYDAESLSVTKYSSCRDQLSSLRDQPTARVDDLLVVGVEDDRLEILENLISGSRELSYISIVGMPGLGKTTMANKLYNDRSVSDHFDRHALCVVSQTYQTRNVLIDILISMTGSKEESEILRMQDKDLGLKIYQSLKGQRYLIFFDDVWDSKMWDDLRRYFPNEVNGSRIMLTSRIKDTAPQNSYFHTVSLLSEVCSWDLLVYKVFDNQPCPPELLDVGKSIAAKCNGLPLVIIVVAGILRVMEEKESSWEEVERKLDSYLVDDESKCMKALELSYKHLPNHLKLCFLYLGMFPEDTVIPAQKLTWLWIAEGFITVEGEKSPEDVAVQYLVDLINRSLLQIASVRSDGGIRGCRMHDLLRDMCLRRADEQNFLKSIKDHSSIYEKHYRLSHYSTSTSSWKHFGLHCRSIICHMPDPSCCFPQMVLLRVIDLLPIKYSFHEIRNIDRLVYLRFLVINKMPGPEIAKLVNLEVLCAGKAGSEIPGVLSKMVKLRHLHIKEEARIQKDWDTCQATNLKSLSNIMISSQWEEEIVRRLTHLRKLKCTFLPNICPDFRSSIQLESLNIKVVYGHFQGELENIHFPSTIKKLTLGHTGLPWEEMSIVGKLPNLHVLKLVDDAFVGHEWETRDGEFGELKFLKLHSLNLNKWITMSQHFPKLERLMVRSCLNLLEVPSELGEIPTLQMIEALDCPDEVNKSVVRIGEEQLEYGNEELKVFVRTTSWR